MGKINLDDPEIKAEFDNLMQYVDAEKQKLLAKNKELLEEKRKLTEKYADIDPDAVRKLMAQAKQAEEAKMLASGDLDALVSARVNPIKTDLEARLNATAKMVETIEAERKAAVQRYNTERINNSIRDAAIQAGVLPSAIPDVLARANGLFSLSEDGQPVAIDPQTKAPKYTGTNPYSPADFLAELRPQAGHFWGQSTGAGLRGSQPSASAIDYNRRIAEAAAKLNQGLITVDEYKAIKAKK